MDLISVIVIAIGLSMDAFAVAVSGGIALNRLRLKDALKIALCFGIFQAGMPLIGWFAGSYFAEYVMDFDHWIAFGLLFFIGGKMIWEALKEEEQHDAGEFSRLSNLLILGIATSIDALAVGINFAFSYRGTQVLLPVCCIGITTFGISLIGVYFGRKFGSLMNKKKSRNHRRNFADFNWC